MPKRLSEVLKYEEVCSENKPIGSMFPQVELAYAGAPPFGSCKINCTLTLAHAPPNVVQENEDMLGILPAMTVKPGIVVKSLFFLQEGSAVRTDI